MVGVLVVKADTAFCAVLRICPYGLCDGDVALPVNVDKAFCIVGATDVATLVSELKKPLVLGKLLSGEPGNCGIPSLARI